MSECEKCGRSSRSLILVNIAGAEMMVCHDCARYGTRVQREPPPRPATPQPGSTSVPYRHPKKDALDRVEKELAEDYPRRIQRAREQKSWSREDLGKKINEKVSVISSLEHGTLYPSDKLVRKLEKTLGVELMEPVEDVSSLTTPGSQGMTLGDFIVSKRG